MILNGSFDLLMFLANGSKHAADMAMAYMCTMRRGVKEMLVCHSLLVAISLPH